MGRAGSRSRHDGKRAERDLYLLRWLFVLTTLTLPAGVFGEAVKAPEPGEIDGILAGVRAYALRYTSEIPNFTCTQTVNRTTTPTPSSNRSRSLAPRTDVIEYQLSMSERGESNKLLSLNGVAAAKTESRVRGVTSRGEFGDLLAAVFDPAAKTEFHWDRRVKRDGRSTGECAENCVNVLRQ